MRLNSLQSRFAASDSPGWEPADWPSIGPLLAAGAYQDRAEDVCSNPRLPAGG